MNLYKLSAQTRPEIELSGSPGFLKPYLVLLIRIPVPKKYEKFLY